MMKNNWLFRLCWFVYIASWGLVYWPGAIGIIMITWIGNAFISSWAIWLMLFASLGSTVVASIMTFDTLNILPLDYWVLISSIVLLASSIIVTISYITKQRLNTTLKKYMAVIEKKRVLNLYELAHELGESDMEAIKANIERLSQTLSFNAYCYDKDNMKIDLNTPDPSSVEKKQKTVTFICASCGGPNHATTIQTFVNCEYCESPFYNF